MTDTFENKPKAVIVDYLRQANTVAVVGLSDREETTSFMIGQALQADGYKIIPVNPRLAGQEILGEKVYANIKDIPQHVDIVDIFRRSEFLPDVARDFIQTDADVFWAQLGLKNEEAAQILRENGRGKVVMDKCIKVEYAYSGLREEKLS
ncbi:CoA-binding protein [Pseudolactococcus paracarnosus]|uniref:CoA-binding protein n=1 Tax=Pseudolactococcus paracarnosus TaxID=2749962 RepID=A0A7L4WAI8_9LACT|nr:CoA-binding protein [Lactococcus paracarnosus]SPC37805.1 putative CoA-binding protein [Lactococcus piscium]MCJ1977392.1 CoA-binding protein [Lactococcus paracarnosus]MCJ1983480.1 CoA-binding protein [Lactococcus paracarnosus]MCJ1993064.1 CoA-binding protein [Lactococcus paracarnosus]MCJ1998166.1 CoA-binding protein [Lactococcus paracarnosus]